MKNFFENKLNKGNPFVNNKDNKGDSENVMADEIKENEQENQEIVEETENTEESVQEEIVEEKTESEAEKLKLALDTLNNQYLRLAADFENYRKRQA